MIYWSIPVLERTAIDNGVIETHWCATIIEKVDEKSIATSLYGVKTFTPDATSPDFVPFDELTEQLVLGWCFTAEQRASMEEELAAQLEKLKSGEVITGLPAW